MATDGVDDRGEVEGVSLNDAEMGFLGQACGVADKGSDGMAFGERLGDE